MIQSVSHVPFVPSTRLCGTCAGHDRRPAQPQKKISTKALKLVLLSDSRDNIRKDKAGFYNNNKIFIYAHMKMRTTIEL